MYLNFVLTTQSLASHVYAPYVAFLIHKGFFGMKLRGYLQYNDLVSTVKWHLISDSDIQKPQVQYFSYWLE